MSLGPGTMVTERIRLDRLLGEGGMGSVWIAEHLTLGTRVAVKFISAELAMQHPELKERFLREAGASAKIASPHVARTFDFGSMSDGTPFLVMELLEGESLSERLHREGALPPMDAAAVISQVAKALSEAHRVGVIHRDIKPGNIFLTRAGRDLFAKVLDFGIAKDVEMVTSSSTKTGLMLGTPQYMSPEQLMSAKGVDRHADLWALSVTAYESLVGSPPFVGETVPHLIVSIHGSKFMSPSSLRRAPVVADSAALDAFFARAFASDKDRRFASALELADAFTVACATEVSAPSVAAQRTQYGAPLDSESAPRNAGEKTPAAEPLPLSASAPSAEPAPTNAPQRTVLGAPLPDTTSLSAGEPGPKPADAPEPAKSPKTTPGAPVEVEAGKTKPSGATIPKPPGASTRPAPKSSAALYGGVAAGALVIAVVGYALSSSGGQSGEPTATGAAPVATSTQGSASATATTAQTTRPIESAEPSATAAPTASASSDAPQTSVEGRSEAARAYFTKFDLDLLAREEVTSLPRAFEACRAKGRMLCTEPQWVAACEQDARLASSKVWTASSEGGRGIVRGGDACGSRAPTASGSARGVACCEQSVGTNELTIADATRPGETLLSYQGALNKAKASEVADHYADGGVVFLGKQMSRAQLEKQAGAYFEANPDQAQLYGRCTLTNAGAGGWKAKCPTLLYRAGKAWEVTQLLTFDKKDRLVEVEEADVLRLQ
ncbi:MAG: protein kinase [Polyangiaceae bacterium]|nr:protein kinase [Polyangiaceae bacterium]